MLENKKEKLNSLETGVGNDMTTTSKRKKTTLPSRRIDKIERFHGNTRRRWRWRGLKRKTAAESSLCCVLPPPPLLVKTRSRGGRRGYRQTGVVLMELSTLRAHTLHTPLPPPIVHPWTKRRWVGKNLIFSSAGSLAPHPPPPAKAFVFFFL